MIDEYLHSIIIFSSIWSFGAVYEENIRPKFHEFIVSIFRGQNTA